RQPDDRHDRDRFAARDQKFVPDQLRRGWIAQQNRPGLHLTISLKLRDVGSCAYRRDQTKRERPFDLTTEKANPERRQKKRRNERGGGVEGLHARDVGKKRRD